MDTIKSSTDISALFSRGMRVHTSCLTFIVGTDTFKETNVVSKRHGPKGRVAFIAGKKLGNAVWRNKAKRRMRAICRDLGGPWDNYDVIFLAKSRVTDVSYSKVLTTCRNALNHANML